MENHKLTPKFFFLSLGVIITLIASVSAFLSLVFETLNNKFPDALNAVYQYGYNSYNFESARASMATLIILFPVFLVLSHFWNKEGKKNLGKIDEVIKKWMVYLILFLSGIVSIVDLVTLVRYFVSGEITTRFILKVVITLAIAIGVGVYYIFVLKGRSKVWGINAHVYPAVKSSILVVALIVWSFSVIGTPKEQRAWRLDDKRVQDLQSIQWQVINFWQQKEKLPGDLKELSNPISGFMLPIDPEFEKGKTYDYRPINNLTFELCAEFSADMPKGWQEYGGGKGIIPMMGYAEDVAVSYPSFGGINESWDHSVGEKCFERTIDPDIYPPFEKSVRY